MELLFLLFVLYMIFSSIVRGLRAAAKQQKTFAPPPVQEPSLSGEQDSEVVFETDPWLPAAEETSYRDDYLFEVEPMQATPGEISPAMKKERFVKAKETFREETAPVVRPQKGKTASAARKKMAKNAGGRQSDLGLLLRGKNLPLAVVAAEVLSNPRSKRPHYRHPPLT